VNLRKVVGVFALLVFVGSLIIHLLTYSGVNIAESYTSVWVLVPVVIVIFVYTLLTAQPSLRRGSLLLHFQQMPKWVQALMMVLSVYFIYNHVVFGMIGMIRNPVPYEVNGKLIYNDHGHITEYTREEAAQARLGQFRAWSGLGAWISFISTAYLLTATPRIPPKS
jgi:hypothetical protein